MCVSAEQCIYLGALSACTGTYVRVSWACTCWARPCQCTQARQVVHAAADACAPEHAAAVRGTVQQPATAHEADDACALAHKMEDASCSALLVHLQSTPADWARCSSSLGGHAQGVAAAHTWVVLCKGLLLARENAPKSSGVARVGGSARFLRPLDSWALKSMSSCVVVARVAADLLTSHTRALTCARA